MISFL